VTLVSVITPQHDGRCSWECMAYYSNSIDRGGIELGRYGVDKDRVSGWLNTDWFRRPTWTDLRRAEHVFKWSAAHRRSHAGDSGLSCASLCGRFCSHLRSLAYVAWRLAGPPAKTWPYATAVGTTARVSRWRPSAPNAARSPTPALGSGSLPGRESQEGRQAGGRALGIFGHPHPGPPPGGGSQITASIFRFPCSAFPRVRALSRTLCILDRGAGV